MIKCYLLAVALWAFSSTFALDRSFPSGEEGELQLDLVVPNGPVESTVNDFNGDGTPDLMVSSFMGSEISFMEGETNKIFKDPITIYHTIDFGWRPYSIESADINLDGRPDLVVSSSLTNETFLLFNQTQEGQVQFSFPVSLGTTMFPHDLEICDLNNDNYPDILVGSRGVADSSITLILSSGPGQYSAPVLVEVDTTPMSLSCGDINNDGENDIIVASRNSNLVYILENEGNGNSFEQTQFFPYGWQPTSVVLMDMNNDQALDIAYVGEMPGPTGGIMGVLLNDGSGTFEPLVSYIIDKSPSSVKAADLTGDQFPELVVYDYAGEIVQIFENGGGADFVDARFMQTGQFPFANLITYNAFVTLADLDLDGDIDIIASNPDILSGQVSTVSVVWNLFEENTPAICPQDLNKDGMVNLNDIIVAIQSGPISSEVLLEILESFGNCQKGNRVEQEAFIPGS